MESDKKGSSMFGTILVMIILVGMTIYYLSNKNQVQYTQNQETQTIQTTPEPTQEQIDPILELETEITNLDTNFDDMNAEDLGI